MTVAQKPAAGRSASYLPWALAALGGSLVVLALNLVLAKYRPGAVLTQCLPALDFLWAFAAGFLLLAGLGNVRVLMGRELATYFQSPLAYVLAALYFLVMSVLIFANTGEFVYVNGVAMLDVMVGGSSFLMVVIAPIITMRLLAEEKSSGTMEILVTDPVTDWDIVLGKFLSAHLCLLGMVLPLGVYVALFAVLRKPTDPALDWGVISSATVGMVCMLAFFASVGLFASSLTGNQVVSALVGLVGLLVYWMAGYIVPSVLSQVESWGPRLREIAQCLSLSEQVGTLIKGQLDIKSVFFFLSTTALVLYFSVRAVESRKWR